MKTFSQALVVSLLFAYLVLPGCSQHSEEADINSLTSEALFGEDSKYAYIHQIMGDMSSRDLFDLLHNMLTNMNAAVRQGDATAEDYRTLKSILQNMHDWMASIEPEDAEESPGLEVLDLMIQHNLGDLMTRAVRTAGPDILTENVFPMMAYVMACDKQIVENAVDGITIEDLGFDTSKLTKTAFTDMTSALHGFLDDQNPDYTEIRDALDTLDALIDEQGLDVTVGDVKDLLPDIDLDDLDDLPVYLDVLSAVSELMDDDPKIKEDLDKMAYAAGYLMQTVKAADPNLTFDNGQPYNAWDTGSMTDLNRVLFCLEDVLKPERRTNLKAFVLKLLNGIDYLDGADNIYGATNAVASIYNMRNPTTNTIADLNEIDYSLYHNMFQLNQFYQPTATDAFKTSEIRSIFLLFEVMCNASDTLYGKVTEALLSLITLDSTGPQIDTKTCLIEWIVGLWGQDCYHYPASYHNSYTIMSPDESGQIQAEYRPYPDPIQGTDWLYFAEDIRYLGIKKTGLSWLLNLVTGMGLPDYVMGSMTESMQSIMEFTGSANQIHTTGQHHRMMTVGGPLIHYYYEQGFGSQLIHLIGALNEMPSQNYKAIAWEPITGIQATYHQDHVKQQTMTAFETIEGPYGYGLPYYLMRGASDERYNHAADLVDPVMDLVIRILYKLSTTSYEDTTLLRALCDVLTAQDPDKAEKTNAQLVEELFESDGIIDNLYTFINTNHADLAQICKTLGNVMLAAVDLKDQQQDIFYTDDIAGLLQTRVLPELGTGLKANRDVVARLVYHALEQAGEDNEDVKNAAANLAGTVCDKADRIVADIVPAIPGIKQLVDATLVDYAYDHEKTKLQPLIDYLTQDVNGAENPFVFNLKSLGYKLTGIYDETYNTRSDAFKIDDDTPVMDVINYVAGDTGIYDTEPVRNFLCDLTGDSGALLWRLIGGGDPYDPLCLNLLEKIFGDDLDDMPSWAFIHSMCQPYNGNDPVMLMILKTIHLEHEGQPVEFTGVMSDFSTILHDTDFQSGTPLFDGIFDALTVVIQHWD